MELSFYVVDVFAEEKYTGNQLAVVPDAGNLTDEEMQRIANETHFSETAFILPRRQRKSGYDVRVFTPTTEVPFAGHPTLGTAWVIKHFMSKEDAKKVKLNLTIGQIPVTFAASKAGEVLWMKQKPPVFGKTYKTDEFDFLLCLSQADFDDRFPIQEVSTGLPFIIVPLKSLDAVKRAKVNPAKQAELSKETKAGILFFAPETYKKQNDLNVRVFVDAFGIPEDPATGSGNGCLAGYLSVHKYFGASKIEARVEQGYEIKRPSLLFLKADTKKGKTSIQVGGQVQLVAKGEFV